MSTYRMMGALAALAMLQPMLSACAGRTYEWARGETAPQPGMKKRCFTPPNPGRVPASPTTCWWYWPKTPSQK